MKRILTYMFVMGFAVPTLGVCLLYTSYAADDLLCLSLGGSRFS